MTGNEMMKKALTLCGYTDSAGEISGEARFKSRALTAINTIYADLFYCESSSGFEPLKNMAEDIRLSERAINDVMPYGVAMHLAQSENDGDNQQLFSVLYNNKRNGLTRKDRIKDVIPYPMG